MPREISDAEEITWSCIQAFAGLGDAPAMANAACVSGKGGPLRCGMHSERRSEVRPSRPCGRLRKKHVRRRAAEDRPGEARYFLERVPAACLHARPSDMVLEGRQGTAVFVFGLVSSLARRLESSEEFACQPLRRPENLTRVEAPRR
jgi:hypothetical protein